MSLSVKHSFSDPWPSSALLALSVAWNAACSGCDRKAEPPRPPSHDAAVAGRDTSVGVRDALVPDNTPPCAAGAPGCPEEIIHRRAWRPARALVADDRFLYWLEDRYFGGHWLMMAPKDGRGPVKEIAPFEGPDISAPLMIRDATRLWWRSGPLVREMPLGGGEITKHTLDERNALGLLVDGGDSIYAWLQGCERVDQIMKDGSPGRSWEIHNRPFAGGSTGVTTDGERLFCGNGQHLSMVRRATNQVSVLLELKRPRNFGPMVAVGGDLFFAEHDEALGTGTEGLQRLRGGTTTPEWLGRTGIQVNRLLHDERRRKVYWITGRGNDMRVGSYDLASDRMETIADQQEGWGGLAMDDDYLYWNGEYRILRLRKTARE